MPIFEYKCSGCGKMEEMLMKSSSAKAPDCPDCGKKMEKQMSSFAAVVKQPPQPSGCKGCPNACPNAR